MMTVTFPSGVRVQYSTAGYLIRDQASWVLYTKKDGDWIASIQMSAGVIVESVPACAVTAPPIPSDDAALDALLRQIESGDRGTMNVWKLKHLKRALATFNAKRNAWT